MLPEKNSLLNKQMDKYILIRNGNGGRKNNRRNGRETYTKTIRNTDRARMDDKKGNGRWISRFNLDVADKWR